MAPLASAPSGAAHPGDAGAGARRADDHDEVAASGSSGAAASCGSAASSGASGSSAAPGASGASAWSGSSTWTAASGSSGSSACVHRGAGAGARGADDHDEDAAAAPSWDAFRAALAELVACHCCGGAMAGAAPATAAAAKPARLRDPRRWREHPAARGERLPRIDGDLVLPDVTLVAPGAPARPRVDVRVRDGAIAAIAPAGTPAPGARIVEEVRGCFVSPALADLHVHMPPWNALRLTRLFLLLTLRHGVTIARDAGDADGSATPAALALVRAGLLPGPELHYAYSFVGRGVARWTNTLRCEAPEDAAAIAEHLAGLGATWIKSYENLEPPHIAALVREGAARGLRVMGHTPTRLGLEEGGVPDCQHYFGAPPPHTLRRDHVFERHVAWEGVDAARRAVLVRASVERGIAHTPTLAMARALLHLGAPADARPADVRLLPRFYRDIVWSPVHGLPAYRGLTAGDLERARRAVDAKLQLTRELHAAGAELRLGTDTQQPFVVPGAALHAELACFRDAGVPADDAWHAATAGAVRALGLGESGAGELREGARAELIASRRDPRESLDPGSFVAVCARGELALCADLDAAIQRELARFEGAVTDHVTRWLARFALRRAARAFVG